MKIDPISIEAKDGSVAEIFSGISVSVTYQIDVSKDDKGHYFDIYEVETPQGNTVSVRKRLHENSEPFKTEAEAIAAGKLWIVENV